MDKEVLSQFVSFMTDTLKQAKDFTLEQAPVVCKEIIHWAIACNTVYVFVGLFLLVVSYFVFKWVENKIKNSDGYDCWGLAHICVTLPTAIAGFCMVIASTLDIVKVMVAPRLFLIDYFANLITRK